MFENGRTFDYGHPGNTATSKVNLGYSQIVSEIVRYSRQNGHVATDIAWLMRYVVKEYFFQKDAQFRSKNRTFALFHRRISRKKITKSGYLN